MLRNLRRLALVTFGAILACGADDSFASSYVISKVLDTDGVFQSFGPPVINNNGSLGFFARFDGNAGRGIFLINDLSSMEPAVQTIAETGPVGRPPSGEFRALGGPSINDRGDIAFTAQWTSGADAVITWRQGRLIPIADSTGSFSIFSSPSINNRGTVAFQATRDEGPDGRFAAILAGRGSGLVTIADTGRPGFNFFDSAPSINDRGTVVFRGFKDEGIFRASAGHLTPVATDGAPFNGFGIPNINNANHIAFRAGMTAGGQGIFIYARGETYLALNESDIASRFGSVSDPGLNDRGVMALLSFRDDGTAAIFSIDGSSITEIIRTGDVLDGSHVTQMFLSRAALNNRGQIAFVADLANGLRGIFVAEPYTATANGD